MADGVTPWPILRRFLDLVESSGDIVGTDQAHVIADEEILSSNVWTYVGKRFEANSFYFSERDAWCYELYEASSASLNNDYVEVQIPDANADGGPFVPDSGNRVTFAAHGQWHIPWPVFRRFIEVAAASGGIVEKPEASKASR